MQDNGGRDEPSQRFGASELYGEILHGNEEEYENARLCEVKGELTVVLR